MAMNGEQVTIWQEVILNHFRYYPRISIKDLRKTIEDFSLQTE
jgi:hypothetical protein